MGGKHGPEPAGEKKARDRAAPSWVQPLSLRDCDFTDGLRGAAEMVAAPAILSIRGQQSFPRHPLRPFRLSDFCSRKSPGPAGALMSACYPPPGRSIPRGLRGPGRRAGVAAGVASEVSKRSKDQTGQDEETALRTRINPTRGEQLFEHQSPEIIDILLRNAD